MTQIRVARRFPWWAALWLALFALVALAVASGAAGPFDTALRETVHQSSGPGLTAVLQVLTHLGSVLVVSAFALAAIAGFWLGGLLREARLLGWSMAGAALLENSLKWAFHRARPEPFFGLATPESYSFPSGHALFATCLYGALALALSAIFHNRAGRVLVWLCTFGVIAAIGFSRIYLGYHFPADVAGGCLSGLFCLACAQYFAPVRVSSRRQG